MKFPRFFEFFRPFNFAFPRFFPREENEEKSNGWGFILHLFAAGPIKEIVRSETPKRVHGERPQPKRGGHLRSELGRDKRCSKRRGRLYAKQKCLFILEESIACNVILRLTFGQGLQL